MIDISVEGKSEPIPDIWIDEFEKLEYMIAKITKEDDGVPETPCPNFAAREVGGGGGGGESPESMRTLSMRIGGGGVDSVFSTPRRGEDSMSSVEEELPEYLRVNGKYEEEEEGEGRGFDLAEEMRRVAIADDDGVRIKQEEEEYEGFLDPQLRMMNDYREDVEIKQEEEDIAFDQGLLDPALFQNHDTHIKQEDEDFEFDGVLPDITKVYDDRQFESAIYGNDDHNIENGEESMEGDEHEQANLDTDIVADNDLDLEEELLRDDNRIFEEYHAIATPPHEPNNEHDHSPFLARIIAELEDLEPLETLTESYSLDPEDGPVDTEDHIDGIKRDGDDFHHSLESDAESDDEGFNGGQELSTRVEIRTSSPLFEHQDLNYDQLESDDDEEGIISDDDDDETTTFDRTVIIDTLPTPSTPPQHLSLDPFSPQKHTTFPSSPSSSESSLDQTITLPRNERKHPHLTTRTPSPPPLPDTTTPPALRTSHLHSKVSAIAHSLPTIALIPQHKTFKPTPTAHTSPEYGYYTLHSRQTHSRQSSVSSCGEEGPRRVDVQGQNLYVRILSDRVMVRVGGGWVDLEQYLREYIGKRGGSGGRRRSGSVASSTGGGEFEFLDLDAGEGQGQGRRSVTPGLVGGRATSSLGVYSSPPRNVSAGASGSGRMSSLDLRRSVSPMGLEEGMGKASGSSTRRMFVRRKQT